jgi:alkanesulfonate monooxygenase SsuD/methylene tetrahydromethanopterin reductase-like flavin-dependent oxidoreductase (luciferase family)
MWPPVLIAEHVGTLAALHPGRFVVQTGLGGGPDSFRRFGVEVRHRGDALDESIRVVNALFAGETVSSAMFGITDASIGLVPPDGVEWWIGTMSEAGIERAAGLGAVWYASHGAVGDTLRTKVETYRNACDRHGSSPTVALRRDAIVLADGDRARALRDEALAAGYRGMDADMVLAGTSDDVAEIIAPLAPAGVDEVMFRTIGASPDTDLETIEALGRVRAIVG